MSLLIQGFKRNICMFDPCFYAYSNVPFGFQIFWIWPLIENPRPRFLHELSASSCTFSATDFKLVISTRNFGSFGEYGIRETIWLPRMFEVKIPKIIITNMIMKSSLWIFHKCPLLDWESSFPSFWVLFKSWNQCWIFSNAFMRLLKSYDFCSLLILCIALIFLY